MQTEILHSKIASDTTPFHIVIIYENFTAGIRAQETAERLANQLQSDVEISVELWKFDLLAYPSTCSQAARDIATADMVVVSTDSRDKLPPYVREWLETALPIGQSNPRALVAIVGEDEAGITWETTEACDYLRQLAHKMGMDFFCNGDETLPDLEQLSRNPVQSGNLLFLEETMTPEIGWRRWGIND